MTRRALSLWFGTLFLAALTSLWSYIFADSNFLLLTHPWYVAFQRFMLAQQSNDWLRAPAWLMLVVGWFALYAFWIRWLKDLSPVQRVIAWLSVIAVLLAGHNALSHDIFNYLFNAKMVMVYNADPHVKTALDFASDPWVRFMHNIHTPAPYGWGWTALSLIPYTFGLGKFALSYLAMRAWMVAGLVAAVAVIAQMEKKLTGKMEKVWFFAWNPLVLIEVALNGHNDVWMMWPALLALFFLLGTKLEKKYLFASVLSIFALAVSIVQKYVTIVLVPVVPLLFAVRYPVFFERIAAYFRRFWPELAVLALLAPLFTSRSQQFHPWYLVWALCFLPLIRSRLLKSILLSLSVASLLRYLPWLDNSLEYSPVILALQKALSATGLVAGIIMWWNQKKYYPKM
jgi:hypothetical protein